MKKILVIDRCQYTVHLIESALPRDGFELLHTEDTAEAPMLVLNEQPHLIALAVEPDETAAAIELIGLVRAWEQTAGIPWVLMSRSVAQIDRQYGRNLPIDGYLAKPLQERMFLEVLERLAGPLPRRSFADPSAVPPRPARSAAPNGEVRAPTEVRGRIFSSTPVVR
ncbi:MAG: response regulator [Planctomycetota bacterium]